MFLNAAVVTLVIVLNCNWGENGGKWEKNGGENGKKMGVKMGKKWG